MLREVAGESDQFVGEEDGLADRRIIRIEPGLADVIVGEAVAIAPHRLGERGGDVLGQAQNLADFADGAAGAVMHDGRADRRAVAAVALVDVLDHLLAPLVLEIDVDVGRLAAVLRNEAGEQEVGLVRVDRGDAEAIAHRAVRRRAAALAQDFLLLPARERHHVVDGEEIARVIELGDDGEFVPQPLLHLGRDAVGVAVARITLLRAGKSEVFEVLLRGLAGRHRLVGIFVCEFGERKAAGCGDLDGAGDRFGKGGEQARHFLGRLEMPLGVDRQSQAGFDNRAFLADAGDDIGERPALRRVIEDVVDGDERGADALRRVRREARGGAARRRDDNARRQETCGPAPRERGRRGAR